MRLPESDDWEPGSAPDLTIYGDPFEPDVLLGPDGEVLRVIYKPFGLARFAAERS